MATRLLDAVVVGVELGSVYALVAFGYNLILGTMGILNLAQGQILALGIMLSYTLRVSLGWNALLALAAVVAVGAALGAAEETVAVRSLRARVRDDGWLVSTLGIALIIQGALLIGWGAAQRPYPPLIGGSVADIDGVAVRPQMLVALGSAVALTLALAVINRTTTAGLALQAIREDREAAAARGINVRRAALTTFALAAAISAAAGWIIAPITFATTSLGIPLGLKGFVATLVGGQGGPAGALAGGLVLGVAESIGTHFGPTGITDVYGFGLLLLVIAVRPRGLVAERVVRRA